jgi:hypothetical protein
MSIRIERIFGTGVPIPRFCVVLRGCVRQGTNGDTRELRRSVLV